MVEYTLFVIENNKSNKKYFGKCVGSIRSRIALHKLLLRHNKHPNSHLQYSWNHYGEEAFTFTPFCGFTGLELMNSGFEHYIERHQTRNGNYGYNHLNYKGLGDGF